MDSARSDFGEALQKAIANHPEIQRRKAKEHTVKVDLNPNYRIMYKVSETWDDLGACTVTLVYGAYIHKWYGWKRIFYTYTSNWGALSFVSDDHTGYWWHSRYKIKLDELLSLLEGRERNG